MAHGSRTPLILAASISLAAAALVAISPAQAETTQTASCVDGGGTKWKLHVVWGDDYATSGVKMARNRVTGFTSSSPAATTVDYSIRTYDGAGHLVQVMGQQDRAFDFARGTRYLDQNPANPPSAPGKAKVVVNVGDGNDGRANCSVTFTQVRSTGVTPTPTPTPTPTASPRPTPSPSSPSGGKTTVKKVLTIVVENKTVQQMRKGMPYTYRLARRYAWSKAHYALTHPSEPNYLALAGGDTFGIANDNEPPSNVQRGRSVFGQAIAAGRTAKTYAESMPSNCTTSGDADKGYAVKHNPWAYFIDERDECKRFDVPAGDVLTGAFISDARHNALPNVGLLVPNTCNDAHDTDLGCSLRTADDWMKARLPTVFASDDFTSGRLMVVVTADEDNGKTGNKVFTAYFHAGLEGKHHTSNTRTTHYSLSKLYSKVTCTTPLRRAGKSVSILPTLGLKTGC